MERYEYELNPVGQRIRSEELKATHTYGYDALQRLTGSRLETSSGVQALSYEYDFVGNRIGYTTQRSFVAASFNMLDQLTQTSSSGLTSLQCDYDAQGAQLSPFTRSGWSSLLCTNVK